MSLRQRLAALFAAFLAAAAPLAALPRLAAAAPAVQSYTFAFQDADVRQVAQAILGDALGVTYTVDPAVTAKVSFRIDKRLTRTQLLQAFEAALATYDVVMVREGDSVTLLPRAKARASAGLSAAPRAGSSASRAGYGTVAVPLSYASPSEVAKALKGMTGSDDIVVFVDDEKGMLVLGGTPQELDAATQTVRTLDKGGLEGASIRFFELQNAPAQTLAQELTLILQSSKVTGVTIVPMRRLNGLFVIGRSEKALDDVARWILRLDVPSKEKASSLWVYHPRNLSADSLAQTLSAALGGNVTSQTTTTAPGSGPGGSVAPPPSSSQTVAVTGGDEEGVRIGVDKDTNTLLIAASPSRWVQIQRILEQIDQTPGQVLIEAYVLEVTLTDDTRLGVDWSAIADSGRLTIGSATNRTGAIGPSYPGFSVVFLGSDLKAAVNALGSRSTVEVVSNPKIFALDNHTGRLQIGDQVPIVTQTGQSTSAPGAPVLNSIEYRSTGVILSVTPRITGDGKVFLTISQEVSSVADTTTAGIQSPTIQQRRIESTVVADDGAVIGLGGMISSSKTRSDSGVPFLKDVPVVGSLFKSDNRGKRRTELVVLLTAHVVRDRSGSDRATADLRADMIEIEARGLIKP